MHLVRCSALLCCAVLCGYMLSLTAHALGESDIMLANIASAPICLISFLLMACPVIMICTWLVDLSHGRSTECGPS